MYNTYRSTVNTGPRSRASTYSSDDSDNDARRPAPKRVPSSSGSKPLIGGNSNLKQAGQNKVNEYAEQMRLKKERAARLREERKMRDEGDDVPPPTTTTVTKPSARIGSGDVLGRTGYEMTNGRVGSGDTHNRTGFNSRMDENGRRASSDSRTSNVTRRAPSPPSAQSSDNDEEMEDRYSSAIKSVAKVTQNPPTTTTRQLTTTTSNKSQPAPTSRNSFVNNRSAPQTKLTPYDLLFKKMTLKTKSSKSNGMDTEEDSSVPFIPVQSRQNKPAPTSNSSTSATSRFKAPAKQPIKQQDPMSEDEEDEPKYEPSKQMNGGRPQPLQQNRQRAQSQPQQQQIQRISKPQTAPQVPSPTAIKRAQQSGMPSEFPEEEEEVDLEPCQICGRQFRADIIARHMSNCQKQSNKKVKKFKVSVIPDELQADVKKAQREAAMIARTQPKPKPTKMPKWKLEHEQFMAILKANKTGAIVPTNPDLDNRVECPTCGRKFNETAADRHIPKCGSIMNKPAFLKRGNGLAGGNLGKTGSPVKPSYNSSVRGSIKGSTTRGYR
jgi:DNA-directed RNA polymerase subunit RPC12/RpoP